jgi:glyoxylate reductase
MTMPDKVLITREIPEKGTNLLENFEIKVLGEDVPERADLLEAVSGASAILSTVTETMDAELMDAAGEALKVIANMAVGYDNVDVEAATERNIVVTNTPGILDETVADPDIRLYNRCPDTPHE